MAEIVSNEEPSQAPAFPMPDIPSFSLQITIHIAPADVDAFFTHFDKIFAQVAREPEIVYFEVFRDPAAPGTISWIENWNVSPKWFFEHQFTKEYYKEYLEKTEPMFVKPREFRFLERMGGKYVVQKAGNAE